MKRRILVGIGFFLCAAVASLLFDGAFRVVQELATPITLDTRLGNSGALPFSISEPLTADSKYSLCFQYNTKGLASPAVVLSDGADAHEIRVDLPRNTWGLGDACLRFQLQVTYNNPRLTFANGADHSSFTVNRWLVAHPLPTVAQVFDRPIAENQWASVYLENNYLKSSFWLPLVGFVLLWLGSGFAITSLISNLSKSEAACIAPITGATVIAFCAYLLSLIGRYNISSLIMLVGLLSVCALYLRLRIQSESTARIPAKPVPALKIEKAFDVVAIILIIWMMSKYIFIAFTPFYATWDGLVSWNKWGEDWALREVRGNYQFTYPQLIPLFYSAYYKLAGYVPTNPLALEMNGVHFFVTYLGLLALPLLYFCSKAMNVPPIVQVSFVLLSNSFFEAINNGYIDNALISYYLACILLVLKVGAEIETSAKPPQNSASMTVLLFIGVGAIFLKQTGIFATAAMALIVWAKYGKSLLHTQNVLLIALVIFVPAEFYVHEIVLDMRPFLVEDNPLNHSIGGILSNAATQVRLLPPDTNWYGNLTDKLAPRFIAAEATPTISLLFALGILGIYAAVSYGLFRAGQRGPMLVWVVVVGGLVLVAMKFGVPGERRYVLLKWPVMAVLAGATASWAVARWQYKHSGSLRNVAISLVILATSYQLYRYVPLAPSPSNNGFDMISYEARLARFFGPEHVRVADYLVARPNQDFRFFTESNFVVWPYTIYDAFTKSTPTRLVNFYRPGDYYYSMFAKECPQGFNRVPLDVGSFAFCVKD